MDLGPQTETYNIRRRIRDSLFSIPGYLYTLFNLPGFVEPIDYIDRLTGDCIRIKIDRRFTIISVNSRDYWFRRTSGKFDGTGYAYCVPIEESVDYILADILESTRPLGLWGRLKLLLQSIDLENYC